MATLDWFAPLTTPREVEWNLIPGDSLVKSGFTLAEQVSARTSLWTCTMRWPDYLEHDRLVKMAGFFRATGAGVVEVFSVPNMQYRNLVGSITSTITTSGTSSAGSRQINIDETTITGGADPLLDRGDMVEVKGGSGEPRLHEVQFGFDAGETFIQVHPVLRADIPSGTQVIHRGDRELLCAMRVVNPETIGAALLPGLYAPGFQITFIEALRRSF